MTWMFRYNKGEMPSLKQISDGLGGEATEQLRQKMGHVQDQLIVLKATENILQTWDDLLKNAEIGDENEALGEVTKVTNKNENSPDGYWYDGPLRDPAHPAVAVFLYLY